MPPRSYPTARQRRLGAELRKLREHAGMTAREAGERLGGNQAQISHIESGRWGVSGDRVRILTSHYSAGNADLVAALVGMADERGKGWWDEYREALPADFRDIAELEHHATLMRTVQTVTVPGIFQTEDYARAMFAAVVPPLPSEEIGSRIEHRVRRRVVFEREAPLPFSAIIHEAALRMRFGGRKVAREQLDFLSTASEWDSVTIRVIPFTSELAVSAQGMLYACGAVPELDTVQLDSVAGSVFLDAEAQLDKYRVIYAAVEGMALDIGKSRDLIHHIAQEL
ncbi:helix-turn-helix transcriptional regulator [Streptomyces sp. RKAG293]|uniref:helix-turn-helix domain-containing protein n=1 Tax=Streptomyces sp. RKAG293 TaxID=2893403 RepID=UPI002033F820|nr:helix-turn-helix transcriptional regulator [Streptomyces sp. RKAG293]MCM2420980.1 helix-turn-helix domain-containing protein [Streptomyces sp. RKAG293]